MTEVLPYVAAGMFPKANALLSQLPQYDLDLLQPHLIEGRFEHGRVLAEADEEVHHVYFPLQGMISQVVVMKDGKAIETATIGHDNASGTMCGFKPYISHVRSIVQVPLIALRIAAMQFREITKDSKPIQNLCIVNNEAILEQARMTAACNALHKVEARFCRWLLQTQDVIDSDTIMLTQEFLSEMLGVRRTSITDVAIKLQSAGIIRYSRGTIRILDRAAMEARTCECYDRLRSYRVL